MPFGRSAATGAVRTLQPVDGFISTYTVAAGAAAAIAIGAASAAVLAHRAAVRRRWFALARQSGRIVIDLPVLRDEHARQVLDDARRDRDLDAVLSDHERWIDEKLRGEPGWDSRFRRRLILATFGSGVLSGATDPGPRPPSPYGGYGYMPVVLAATVRLADRPIPWLRVPTTQS